MRLLALFIILLLSPQLPAAATTHDLIVYGATPSGIAAAVTAAREDKNASILLIEPTAWIGGLVTGGLCRSDIGNAATIGGFPLEFFTLAAKNADPKFMWYADPKYNMTTFQTLLKNHPNITLITTQRLQSVTTEDRRIQSLTTTDGSTHTAEQFIDASYEGDLMAQAGVSYLVGRESRDQYNEPLAGFTIMPIRERSDEIMSRAGNPSYIHGTPAKISALDDNGNILFGVFKADPTKKPGDADGLTQAYNYRIVVTQRPDLLGPFPKPQNYDPKRYELLLRLTEAFPKVAFGRIFHLGEIANGKYDLNAQGLFSTDHPGFNTDYPDGDWTSREKIIQEHIDHLQGMLWFLSHDPRVPQNIRDEANTWGLCNDEFTDNQNWPYALYIREGRRMIGSYVMRQQDLTADIKKPDSIAMGSFLIDCHIVQRVVTEDGHVTDEGSFQDTPARPYHIAYRSITPKIEECENLLVTVTCSASHIAYCSMRMEPVYMALGHAAGLASIQALKNQQPVQSIDVAALQQKLLAQKAVIDLNLPDITLSTKLPGIVQDDQAATYTGHWTSSGYGNPIDGSSHHDGGDDQGNKTATFTIAVPENGKYQVRLAYAPAPNRASNVPIIITHADGEATHQVNQKTPPKDDPHFTTLGSYSFKKDQPAIIQITNKDANGIVGIDAIQLLPESK
ncbi:FAD-dependent oxidoreductase [Phragmitibacter flavus]|uniref:FAD-dependent oxidoreductase n=1 Tax=Phragmitibacter flavus TaxID=2576071 RepID=A0A5R8K9U8_9BACT|nr:FAD-dependent oxidoreductase [Phragmitibacter flavus]TLD68695.1 FAD-dependent oxidoreductase [Phragmitibacter flavus]